jgi:hypothetical protein
MPGCADTPGCPLDAGIGGGCRRRRRGKAQVADQAKDLGLATPSGTSAEVARDPHAAGHCPIPLLHKDSESADSESLAGAGTGYQAFDKSSCREVDKAPK